MKITKSQLKRIIKEELKVVLNEEKSISDKELEELKTIKDELRAASKMHKGQAERIEGIIKNRRIISGEKLRPKKQEILTVQKLLIETRLLLKITLLKN